MSGAGVSPVPGTDGWEFGAFTRDGSDGEVRVPVVRAADGKTSEFVLPQYVNDPQDIAAVARIVIGAIEHWEALEGLGG